MTTGISDDIPLFSKDFLQQRQYEAEKKPHLPVQLEGLILMSAFETWILLLQAARASEPRDPIFSENCLRKALKSAEEVQGEQSAEAGLCLAELAVFLKRNGKAAEAEQLSLRYREIFREYTREGQSASYLGN